MRNKVLAGIVLALVLVSGLLTWRLYESGVTIGRKQEQVSRLLDAAVDNARLVTKLKQEAEDKENVAQEHLTKRQEIQQRLNKVITTVRSVRNESTDACLDINIPDQLLARLRQRPTDSSPDSTPMPENLPSISK